MSKRSKLLGTYGSFKPKNKFKTRFGNIIKILVVFFLVYQIFTTFIVASFIVQTTAMEPDIPPGQKILSAPIVSGTSLNFPRIRIPGFRKPVRGEVVLIRPGNVKKLPGYVLLADSIVRFFTLQKKSIIPTNKESWNNQVAIKRIIAVPGDTVKMINFKFLIKPKGETGFIAENDLSQNKYSIKIPKEVPGMEPSFPFSGNMAEVKITDNQYFVVNDNRGVSYDSRLYGPVPRDNILGPVFLSYGPGFTLK